MNCALWGLMFILMTATGGFAQTCGNGVVEQGEQCDGGNTSGGCCTAQCTYAAADSTCYDGNPNTIDSCNAAGVCVGRFQTTTCGACRDPNDAQDKSYCDLTTNQCVRQIEDCPPFFIEADGSQNKCQSNYGRDSSTGQCLYRPKQCVATGCLGTTCNPTSGACELVTSGPRFIACGGRDDSCSIPANGGCPTNTCQFASCLPGTGDPSNCALSTSINCVAQNRSSCQVGVPASTPQQINSQSCQLGSGCVYAATACAPPSNPCEELVRDGNASGCCTYQPRDCAAEFGNNPNFTYSCDPTAINGVCQAVIKPEQCNGADDNGNGQVDEGFPDTDGDGQADCVDADDDNDNVPDTVDNCPLTANSNQIDTDGDGQGDGCDADDDNDGVLDANDNCPLNTNPDQRDSNGNGIGDACELYNFTGFFQPVENLPTVNRVNAGQAIPIKFSLSGDKGLNIFAVGFPISRQIACDSGAPSSTVEETASAGSSSLTYNAASDQYSYIWKTDKAWKGTCRLLTVQFIDGSEYSAQFRFK